MIACAPRPWEAVELFGVPLEEIELVAATDGGWRTRIAVGVGVERLMICRTDLRD